MSPSLTSIIQRFRRGGRHVGRLARRKTAASPWPHAPSKWERCLQGYALGIPPAMTGLEEYRTRASAQSGFQAIAGPEDPDDDRQAREEESQRRRQADCDAYVRVAVEAPAKAADQVDDRIEQR